MNRRLVTVSIAALGLACHEPTTASNPIVISPGFLKLQGGVAFDAAGAPTFKDKAVVPATFAPSRLSTVSRGRTSLPSTRETTERETSSSCGSTPFASDRLVVRRRPTHRGS